MKSNLGYISCTQEPPHPMDYKVKINFKAIHLNMILQYNEQNMSHATFSHITL